MSLKCIIVDDESIARKLLADYVAKVPELELVATCGSALQAMNSLKSAEIDIMFLDIQMPDLTGLDFLKVLPNKLATILTTAHSEYAVQSYELDVADYLLKPIEFDRFYKAVSKVIATHALTDIRLQQPANQDQADKLFVKADNKIIKVDFDEIVGIKAQGPYVQIITTGGSKIMSLCSMSKLEDLLPRNFYRTHRSYIVNINHIDSIEGNTIHSKDHSAALSKNKRSEFLGLIDQFNLLGD